MEIALPVDVLLEDPRTLETMIAAVVIGIAVDDGIHVLTHYQHRRRRGDAPAPAMQAAVLHCGRAVVTTSLALALGFLTLSMSAWQTIASFGVCVALAISVALFASLLVLPALVFAADRAPGPVPEGRDDLGGHLRT